MDRLIDRSRIGEGPEYSRGGEESKKGRIELDRESGQGIKERRELKDRVVSLCTCVCVEAQQVRLPCAGPGRIDEVGEGERERRMPWSSQAKKGKWWWV